MKAKLCIVGYKPIINIAQKISSEFSHSAEFIYINSILEEALPYLEEIEGVADLILTGPSTRRIHSKLISTPIISFRPTFPDLIKAIQEAHEYSKDIAICLSHEDIDFDLSLLSQVMNVGLFPAYCTTGEEYRKAVNFFKEEGFKVLVGGSFPTQVTEEIGLVGICFYKGMDMIRTAIRNALEIYKIQQEGISRLSQLTAVINNFTEGLLLTDEKGKVVLDNPPARSYLGMRDLVGKRLSVIFNSEMGLQAIKQGGKILNVLEKGNVVVNYVSIRSPKKIHGLVCTLKKVDDIQDAEINVRKKLHSQGFIAKYNLSDIVGESQLIIHCKELASQFALADGSILITGETGTGKELFAHSIHNLSSNRAGPFVAINCATLPSELLESELFGYEKGAFTGAHFAGKRGLIELAHKGTLFLDEITTLNNILQAKLLRLLSEKEILKLGSDRIIPVEIRVIGATNEDIESCVRERRFREDLYYRLCAFQLHIPPLRERPEDLFPLFLHFVTKFQVEIGDFVLRKKILIQSILIKERFNGNVRQLENVAKRFCLLFRPEKHLEKLDSILHVCLGKKTNADKGEAQSIDLKNAIQHTEKMIIEELVKRYKNKNEISEILNLHRSSLYRKIKKYGIGN